jgi:hypothetical protein
MFWMTWRATCARPCQQPVGLLGGTRHSILVIQYIRVQDALDDVARNIFQATRALSARPCVTVYKGSAPELRRPTKSVRRKKPILQRRRQGLTLAHVSAQRKRFLLDRGYIYGLFTG